MLGKQREFLVFKAVRKAEGGNVEDGLDSVGQPFAVKGKVYPEIIFFAVPCRLESRAKCHVP